MDFWNSCNTRHGPGGLKIVKKLLIQALIAIFALNPPLYAQEAIEIEIDSAPVEIEIPQPAPPAREETPQVETRTAQTEAPEEEKAGMGGKYGVAIGIGALVAGALAALAGGGGSSTSSH